MPAACALLSQRQQQQQRVAPSARRLASAAKHVAAAQRPRRLVQRLAALGPARGGRRAVGTQIKHLWWTAVGM